MRVVRIFSFNALETGVFSLLILLLPTQFGKHFWPEFAFIDGIRIDYLSPTIYTTDLLICCLFLLWLRKIHSDKSIPRMLLSRSYMFFFALLLGSMFLSQNFLSGVYSTIKVIEYSFLFIYVRHAIPSVISLTKCMTFFAVSIITEAILSISQYLTQSSIGGLWYYLGERSFSAATPGIANASLNGELVMRAYGTFSHPNVFAGYLVVSMIFIFFYLYPSKERAFRRLASFALLLGSIALILTLSRLAIALWILLMSILFVSQIIRFKQRSKLITYRWFFLVVLLGIIFAHLLAPRFLETSLTEDAFVQRQVLTQQSVDMVLERPVMGVGPGNFLLALNHAQSPLTHVVAFQPVHNIFLFIAAEIGSLGLIFFVWFLGKTYQRLSQHQSFFPSFPITLSLSVILLLGLNDHYWLTLQQGQLLFVLALGLAWRKDIS